MQPLGLGRVAPGEARGKGDRFDFAALSGWRAVQWVDDWIGAADLVIIDAPPHPETEARIAVRVARLWSVPFSHFHSTLWATAETLKIARDEGSLSS